MFLQRHCKHSTSHLSDLMHLRCYYIHTHYTWDLYWELVEVAHLIQRLRATRESFIERSTIKMLLAVCAIKSHVISWRCVRYGLKFQHSFFSVGVYSRQCEIESSLKISRTNIVVSCCCCFLLHTLNHFVSSNFFLFLSFFRRRSC